MQAIDEATGKPVDMATTLFSPQGVGYSTLLAYPKAVLRPTVNSEDDKGQALLELLRCVLLSSEGIDANRDNLKAVFDWVAASDPGHHAAVRDAFMESRAPKKPSIHLVQQQQQKQGDACFVSLDAVEGGEAGVGTAVTTPQRLVHVAVQSGGEKEDAFANVCSMTVAAPVAVIKAEYHPEGGTRTGVPHVYVSVTRVTATSVVLVARSSLHRGEKIARTFVASLKAVDELFGGLERPGTPGTTGAVGDVPRAPSSWPGALPEWLQVELAAFWQRIMRCHLIPSVCRGESGTTRPLVFEEFTTRVDQDRLYVRGTLHVSRAVCICGLWGARHRNPSRDAEVQFELSMCGKALNAQSMCARCTTGTPPTNLKVCVARTTASITCKHHDHDDRKRKRIGKGGKDGQVRPGLELQNVALGQEARRTAQLLMEAAAGARLWCYSTDNAATFCQMSEKQSGRLKRRMEKAESEFALQRVSPSEMAHRDHIVFQHLRQRSAREEGALKIYRSVKRGTGEPSLVLLPDNASSAGGGGESDDKNEKKKQKKKPTLPVKYAHLVPTHAHLFPPLCKG